MLVLPLLFSNIGIIGGAMVMFVTGTISCKANLIYIEHFKPSEIDYQNSIR